jgi:hypothetical protein
MTLNIVIEPPGKFPEESKKNDPLNTLGAQPFKLTESTTRADENKFDRKEKKISKRIQKKIPNPMRKLIYSIRALNLFVQAGNAITLGLSATYAYKKFVEGDNVIGSILTVFAVLGASGIVVVRRLTSIVEKEMDPNREAPKGIEAFCENLLFRC